MTEQAIIAFHSLLFFFLLLGAITWNASDWLNVLIKCVFYTFFFWNAAILATWFGWIKII